MALLTPIKISETEKKNARAAGFRRKKPSKPKGTITESKYNAYVRRHNDYAKALKEKAKIGAAKLKEKEQKKTLRAKLSGL